MACRMLLSLLCAVVFVFSGCGKRPRQVQSAPVPRMAVEPARPESVDVFKKYYAESQEPARAGKEPVKTFSMNAPEPSSKPSAESGSYTPSFSKNGRYAVQVASLGSRWLADELSTEFKEKGYPAYVTEITNPTPSLSGTFFRVRIGGFASIADAQAFGENILKPARYDFWVDRRAHENAPAESQSYSSPSNQPQPAQPATDWRQPIPSASPAQAPEQASPAAASSGPSSSGWQTDTGAKW